MRLFGKTFSKREIARVAAPIAVLALIASVVAGRERPSEAVAEPATRMNARIEARSQVQDQDLDLSGLFRGGEAEGGKPAVDPFARRGFAPGPQSPQAAQASAPEAPPLPFRYVGKMIEDGNLAVFLARGEDSYSVHAGQGQKRRQQLDEQYRVDKVTETSVTFTYLPLKTKQTLDIPAAN